MDELGGPGDAVDDLLDLRGVLRPAGTPTALGVEELLDGALGPALGSSTTELVPLTLSDVVVVVVRPVPEDDGHRGPQRVVARRQRPGALRVRGRGRDVGQRRRRRYEWSTPPAELREVSWGPQAQSASPQREASPGTDSPRCCRRTTPGSRRTGPRWSREPPQSRSRWCSGSAVPASTATPDHRRPPWTGTPGPEEEDVPSAEATGSGRAVPPSSSSPRTRCPQSRASR